MSQRYFAHDRITIDGKYIRAYRVQCSLCRRTEKVQMNTQQSSGAGHDDEQLARRTQRKFEERGWAIGKRERDDLCCDCRVDKLKSETPSKLIQFTAAAAAPDRTSDFPPAQSVPIPKANGHAAPLTREARRLIYMKLEEVYESESTGYKDGWSDDHVARDLELSLAWVETVRKENFGEWNDNPTLRGLIEETDKAIADSKAICAAVQTQSNELQRQFDVLKGSLAESQRAAQRVLNVEARLRAAQKK
jgi:hypothetical protein